MAALAAPPSLASPPTSPDVAEQQSPTAQFAQGYQPQVGEGGANSAMELAAQNLNQVASLLKDVAKVLVTSKPNLMPILQRMVQAGSMLMNEVQSNKPGSQVGQAGVQRQPPETAGAGPEGGAPPPA